MSTHIVDVLVPVALDQAYSYRVPPGVDLAPGDLVRVPLGSRATTGAVWGKASARQGLDNRLREIEEKLELPPLRQELRRFIDWVADYTLSSRGMVLRMALRMGEHFAHDRPRMAVRLAGPPPARMTAPRQRVLDLLADGLLRAKRDVVAEAGVSSAVIDALIDAGALDTLALPQEPVAQPPEPDHCCPELTPAQAAAAASLRASVAAQQYQVTLLDGITGSGKTQVYFEAIAAAIRQSRQALVLLPEIALTAQFLDRFAQRFGSRPAVWHSGLSPRLRARTWAGVASGEIEVVVGARSALFLPYARLGLIVVDEEHDPAYKQEDGVRYHARDMAVVRAHIADIPVVLASATPSIETEVNARRGRYQRLRLPERFGGQHLPAIEAIDLRREGPPRGRFVAPRLVEAVRRTLDTGEQALLFLNRRGYAPLTLCRACGFRLECPHCDAWLVEHRFRRSLVCHHCGFAVARPQACPKCGSVDALAACGPGVERLEEQVATLFPDVRALVLSSDLVAGVERLREEFSAIENGKVDIVIGTQLIAKGHHFPKLNLVGIVDADLGLGSGDPRAAERTFQLLHQVLGRAGRGAVRGRGLIQTHQPQHPVMQALIAGDREAFYDAEIAARERGMFPPFGRLASLIVSGSDRAGAELFARRLAAAAPADAARVLGPAEAPIAVIRGRHRFRLLVKAKRSFPMADYLRHWLAQVGKPAGQVRIEIDVDPQSFM
jgi:primosomal protein N' (replication factor Y) (superfamily II helicase)